MSNAPYGNWLPWDASEHGYAVDHLINVIHWFMALLFVAWGVFFVMCLRRFRQRDGHTANYALPKAKISKYAEVAVVVFEGFLLFALSMPAWGAYKNSPPSPANREEVHAVGQQFQWNFHYPGKDGKFGRRRPDLITPANPLGLDDENDPDAKDDIVSTELHVPLDKPVYVTISSKDVIHSFAVPVLRVKQDAVPGIQIPVWFTAKRPTSLFRDALTRTVPIGDAALNEKPTNFVPMQDYAGKDGKPIIAAGGNLSEAILKSLKDAGVNELRIGPVTATEVVCAQLCGNNHFKMTAPLIMETLAQFEDWKTKKKAPPAAPSAEEFQQ
jgi:cytochrome c oxidase subunit 2